MTAGAVLLGTPPRSRRGARPLALLGAALVLLAVAGPLAVWWGDAEALARGVLRGSDRPAFRDVVSELVGPEGSRTLVVSGEIVNPAGRPVALSPLEFLVRTGDEQVLVAWTSAPPRPDLGPGEAARFEARLPQPPPQGRDVRVHFTRVRGAALAALTDSR